MAARLNPRQDERTRSAIKTSQLVNRLQGFALSEADKQTGRPIEMTGDQVRAAIGLIKKTLPDLQSVVVQGDEDKPLRAKMEVVFVRPVQG